MKFSRASLLAGLALASGLATQHCLAAVTPYSWIRGGEGGIFADSSGNNHPFNAAFSSRAGGDPAALIVADSVGGPLGNISAISTLSTRWGYYSLANSGMWVQGPNNTPPPASLWSLPASNWVVEVWVKPVGTGGSAGHTDAQFVSTGSPHFGGKPGGVAFRTHYNSDDDTVIGRVDSIGSSASDNFTIGDTTVLSKDHWTHLAAVNDNGVTTFYVNGVANGPSTNNVTAPSGVPYIGSGEDTGAPFDGYLDEIRYSTFAPGAFAVSDLLLLPPGASIIAQPKSATVWSGGPAIFQIKTPVDSRTTFQWKLNGQPITAATSANLYLPAVTLADSGKVYSVVLSNSGVDVTSSNATLTVVAPETANNNFYRQAVQSESSLLAYFPVDNDSGAILTNVKDASHNGTIQGNASFDGRTDRAYGIRSLRLNGDGDVSVPANPNYEFTDRSGTIEAIVYLDKSPVDPSPENIFSIATGEGSSAQVYYQFQVSADGTTLLYSNDTLTSPVSWNSPVSLLNRFTHVALVFDNHGDADPANDTVTAFVDGLSLGAKPNPSFGAQTGLSANIGSASVGSSGLPVGAWNGNIDELAIYGDALSSATIAIHNSRFIYGTNVSKPTIVSAPTGSSTYLAGGAPSFRVNASGTAPLTYEWKLNGAPIANNPTASTASFTILNSTVNSSGTYTVTVSNPIGEVTSDPFTVTFNPVPAGDKYASFILGDHPSAFWRLDETTGTNLVDYAGGHNGTYHGDVQLGKEGAPGTAPDTAAHFPGSLTGGIPNAVVPYSADLNPTGPFSLEFWAKPDVGGQVSQAVVASQNRNAGRAGYVVYQGFNGPAWEGHLGVGDGAKIVIGQTVPVAGRWDHIVFVWDGNSIGRIWVNGVDDTRSDSDTGGPLRPNLNVPLEIGSRFNGQFPYQGTVDEVAFYNYALTSQQITQHFSIAWVAAAITTQPANTNVTEAGTLTLKVAAAGYPNTYQWFKGDTALDPATANFDNSLHFPQGVTGPTLVISQLTADDAGQYHVVIGNPLGEKTSATATVAVANDTTAPTVVFVGAGSTNRVRVVFSRPISANTISVPVHYSVSGGVTVSDVAVTQPALASSPSVVDLITSGLTPGQQYTVSVTGVKDTRANNNVIGTNSTSFTAPVLRQGILNWDFYENIGGTSVESVTSDLQYPEAVYTNLVLTNFSTSAITGGDLAGNPGFGSLGNNYGSHVYGWLTPKEGGTYTFFLRSDDASELWLSTDAQAANVAEIAYEPGCCNGFLEQKDDGSVLQTSQPIHLDANKPYYIEAFQKEGGGGDYVEVAWRKEGDTTAAGSLKPIPGSVLSAYGPAVVADLKFNAPTLAAGKVTITWTGTGTLQESTDFVTWTPVAGNPASGLSVTPAAGTHKFYQLVH